MITVKFLLLILFSYLSLWQPHYFGFLINIYPGIYSLVGAVSFLGGVKRMILSFTVILIECTNETSLGLPILLTLMVSLVITHKYPYHKAYGDSPCIRYCCFVFTVNDCRLLSLLVIDSAWVSITARLL